MSKKEMVLAEKGEPGILCKRNGDQKGREL